MTHICVGNLTIIGSDDGLKNYQGPILIQQCNLDSIGIRDVSKFVPSQ